MPHPETGFAPSIKIDEQVTEIAYAKVNIALHVRARRGDGYHALESLFVFAEDGDRLKARTRADDVIALRIEGPFAEGLAADEDNLVIRAAQRLRAVAGVTAGADIRLDKRLPVASGIGGGSADAAATLRLLMRLWKIDLEPGVLHELALSLGSDVPACVASVTQMVRGRGDVLEAAAPEGLAGKPMLLVNPGVAVSTARVFAGWDQVDRGGLEAGNLEALIHAGRNDLEAPALAVAPVIGDVLTALRREDAVLARMSGSGATCFALFEDAGRMGQAAETLRRAHSGWWIMETRIRN